MNEVWVVWPAARPEKSKLIIDAWHDQGYKVAVLVNPPHGGHSDLSTADRVIVQDIWKGFATAANILCHEVLSNVVVVAGDDMYPDQSNRAQTIADAFEKHFNGFFGVMQPTGDRYGCIDKCAVAPWIGRAFIDIAYGGKGPYWEDYFHYFADEELQTAAEQCNAFWQRRDLSQYHDHWQRKKGTMRPEYLIDALSKHPADAKLFQLRKAAKFPTL